MKMATLVTGLQKQAVYRGETARYISHTMPYPLMATDGELLMPTEEITVKERIVPITQFCYGNGKPDLYVAYSHEVEEILGIPFRIILKERSDAFAENERLRSLSAWDHIKTAYGIIKAELLNRVRP